MDTKADRERILTSTPKDHTCPGVTLEQHERKMLQTLQLSATGNKLNGGKERAVQQKDFHEGKQKATYLEESPIIKPTHSSSLLVKIYEDPRLLENVPIAHCSRLTQTDDGLLEDLLQERIQDVNGVDDSGRESGYIDKEAYDLMVKEEVSETYWKDIAEERRRALKESLAENEKLYSKLEHLEEENKKLKGENVRLMNIAAKAEALKKLLEGVLSDDEDTEVLEDVDGTGLGYTEAECNLVSDKKSGPGSSEVVTGAGQGTDGYNKILDTDIGEKQKEK